MEYIMMGLRAVPARKKARSTSSKLTRAHRAPFHTCQKLREFLPEFIEQQRELDTGSSFYVKSPVFPWNKFPGVDTVLGPEMKSTGEVMGVADNFGEAFAKAQLSAGQ